jgi:hypothetical protein
MSNYSDPGVPNGAVELDNRPMPQVTYRPAGHLVCGHQLKIHKIGKIILPTGAGLQKQYDTIRVLVLAVGPEVTACKPGDIVLFADSAPCEMVIHKGHLTVMFRDDLFLALEGADDGKAEGVDEEASASATGG